MRLRNRSARLSSISLAISLTLGLPIPSLAATLLSEDFEVSTIADLKARGWELYGNARGSGDFGNGNAGCNPYCSGDIVTSPVHGGSYALRYIYQGQFVPFQSDIYNVRLIRGFNAQPEIYVRYYLRTEPIPPATQSAYDAAGSSKQHYLKVDGTSPDGLPNNVLNHMFGDPRPMFTP